MRPSVFVEEWPEKDRLLAEALVQFEESAHCPGCGQLKSRAWDDRTDGYWEQESATCHGCAAVEQARDSAEKTGEKSEAGTLNFLVLHDGWDKKKS